MTRSKRRRRKGTGTDEDGVPARGTGGFLGGIGLFESANGLPHGPGAIVMAIVAALILYPLSRLLRTIVRR
jgi:hypothetical protein